MNLTKENLNLLISKYSVWLNQIDTECNKAKMAYMFDNIGKVMPKIVSLTDSVKIVAYPLILKLFINHKNVYDISSFLKIVNKNIRLIENLPFNDNEYELYQKINSEITKDVKTKEKIESLYI